MDDITALLMEKNNVVVVMAKKVMKKLKEEVEKKGFELSVTENGKEGKSKMIASFWRTRCVNAARRMSDDGRQRGNAWRRLENQSQEVGS